MRAAAIAAGHRRGDRSVRHRHGEPRLSYLVKQVELAIRADMDAHAREHGLTALQYTALTVLQRQPGMSGAQLSRRSFVSPQAGSEMVAHLERKGSDCAGARRRQPARPAHQPHGGRGADGARLRRVDGPDRGAHAGRPLYRRDRSLARHLARSSAIGSRRMSPGPDLT